MKKKKNKKNKKKKGGGGERINWIRNVWVVAHNGNKYA